MSKTPVTRREFLNLLAAGSGTAAILAVGSALGMLPASAAVSVPRIMPLENRNRRVVILGAGISGLTVAYELARAGYQCDVLEASHRAGGRVMTVRHGDFIDEIGNPQICRFDDEPHMYFNCGAARIPSTHRNVLHYCKELGVELEVFVNENKQAWVHDENFNNGKPVRNGVLSTNLRGFMAEMMAKAFSNEELDQPFSPEEAEKLLTLIREFGDLNDDNTYTGSTRAGYASGGFLNPPEQMELIKLRDLLKANTFTLRQLLVENEGETAPILMQAIGGNDNVIRGFTRQLGDRVKYQAMVKSVMLTDDGVEVVYSKDGAEHRIEADYCFNCIPSHLMSGITNNFPPEYRAALRRPGRGEAYKGAFQAKERFWEDEGIYGGISWTSQPIRQIWYPPHGINKQKGVMLAAYDYGGGMHFTRMTQDERIESMLAQGEKIHPEYRSKVEHGVTIAWHRMNHMLGCSARWGRMDAEGEYAYQTLQKPVGRHYMIGDQISRHTAWMESAIRSAHFALADMDQRERVAAGRA